jgi:hypothetical protein
MKLPENGSKPKSSSREDEMERNANGTLDVISTQLRGFYDSVMDEGTPDHILNLLERLEEAERKAAKSTGE